MAYVSKKDLLSEIHKCKMTYCHYIDPIYCDQDVIVNSLDEITPELLAETVSKRGPDFPAVFRVMTDEHIPVEDDKKKRSRVANSERSMTNFPPFKHYILKDGKFEEVLRSHWTGGFENGYFTMNIGRLTPKMGRMLKIIVENYARLARYRSYSYIDDMIGNALLHLSAIALKFDEAKSDNPFGFYTISIKHCFVRVLNIEKRVQEVRDDLLAAAGVAPSISRQIENEMAMRPEFKKPDLTKLAPKRGRKTAVERKAIQKSMDDEDEGLTPT